MAIATSNTIPMPRLQPITFFSIGNSGSARAPLTSPSTFVSAMSPFRLLCRVNVRAYEPLARQRRRDASEEDPGDQKADPDHEAEHAQQIDGGEFAEAFLPEHFE